MKSTQLFSYLLVASTFMLPTHSVAAESEWPSKQVRLVVPYPPGGSADTLGRSLAHVLSTTFKQTVVVENRAGASGMIGSQMVARAEPDGHTLVVSGIGSHVLAPWMTPGSFDPVKDFTHIAFLGGPPAVFVVNADGPVKDLPGFIALAKGRADGASWGSPGLGTHGSLIGEVFSRESGLSMIQAPYKGANAAVTDLMSNQIQAAFITLSSATAGLKSDKLRAIALTSHERLEDFPDVPTFKELGYPKLTGTTWFSLSGPPTMSKSVVDQINKAVRQALQTPAMQKELRQQNMVTEDWDAATFSQYVQSEIAHWTPYLKPAAEKRP